MQNVNVIENNNGVLSTFEKVERCKQINQERLGETRINNMGSKMFIVQYNSYSDITVQFEDGYIVNHVSYGQFKNGSIKNPFDESVYGIGYIGIGEYKANDAYGYHTKQYITWKDMLRRCYSEKSLKEHPTYIGCVVCDEWLNFQNFAKWYDENYYEIEGKRMDLDKDILTKGNKIYSPETCVFVPQNINVLFVKRNASRGDLPIGVSFNKRDRIYQTICRDGKSKTINLGSFKTPEEAFQVYKQYKENLIKQIADEYKEKIPNQLYEAMVNYTVSIND